MKAPSKKSALVRNHSKSSLAYSKVLDEKSSSSSFSGCTKLMTDNMFIGLNSIKHLEGLSERCVTPKFFSKCSHCVIRNPCWTLIMCQSLARNRPVRTMTMCLFSAHLLGASTAHLLFAAHLLGWATWAYEYVAESFRCPLPRRRAHRPIRTCVQADHTVTVSPVRERLMAAKYASIDVCLSPDQLHASNPGRQAGRQAGARAQHQGSERAERAARNKQTQCHGCARAPVRASPPARRLTAACAWAAPGARALY